MLIIQIEFAAHKASRCYFCFFQIIQELEKQRIEVLCSMLSRYNLHMSSFGQIIKHVRHADLHPAQQSQSRRWMS